MKKSKHLRKVCVLPLLLIAIQVISAEPLFGRQAGSLETAQQRDPVIIRTDQFSLELRSRLQLRFTYLDPDQGEENGSFSVRRARLTLRGDAYEHFDYAMQLELAGSAVNLLDANISYTFAPVAELWVGQGKTPFGRQQLTSSGSLNFVDRSIVNSRFTAGRQAGVALKGQSANDTFEYAVGVYNGTGINSANNNNRYMKVARVVFTPLGAYSPSESALDYPETPRLALGLGGLHTTETTGSDIENSVSRFNVEGAFKLRGFSILAEYFGEASDPDVGSELNTYGWHTQAGYLLPDQKNELVVRYGRISPDTPGDVDVIETGVALNHYISRHNAKVQADLRNVHREIAGTNDLEFRVQLQISL